MLLFYIFAVSVYSCDITIYNCSINYFDCRNEDKSSYYDYSIDLMLENITVYTITRYIRESIISDLCLFTAEYPTCGSLKHVKNYIECYYCSDIESGFAVSPDCNTYIKKQQTDLIIGFSTSAAIILVGLIIAIIYYKYKCSNNTK